MVYAIVANSKSGNTRMLAEALAGAVTEAGVELSYAGEVPEPGAKGDEARASVAGADAVLAGFWTDKGDCTGEMREFLEGLAGKRVFLFGTCGFGGSDEYFSRILTRVAEHLPEDAELVGTAMCQGKMGAGVRRRYEAMLAEDPDSERVKGMIANFDAALEHPSEADLERVVAAARAALGF